MMEERDYNYDYEGYKETGLTVPAVSAAPAPKKKKTFGKRQGFINQCCRKKRPSRALSPFSA